MVTKTFVWGHLPDAAGDTVATALAMFPEIIEFADPPDSPEKHALFQDRPDLVAGRQRILCLRRLPSWQLNYSLHKSRYGLHPDYLPLPMDSPAEMRNSAAGDGHLAPFVEGGGAWPDRWIRVEYLADDLLALLEEHVDVTAEKREQIRALARRNAGSNGDSPLNSGLTEPMVNRLYERNPLWHHAEQLAYAGGSGGVHEGGFELRKITSDAGRRPPRPPRKSMIEVVSVNKPSLEDLEGGPLKSANVDLPGAGAVLPGYSIEIVGWAVASRGAVDRIDILHGDVVVRTASITEPRPDVSESLGIGAANTVGFRTRVGLLGLPLEPTLRVVANVAGERLEIAELVLRREPLRVVPAPPIHPLIVTTMGRTGSVWFSRLVGEHPAIVSYRPFESEPRLGSYWAQVLRALSDPASVMQALAPRSMEDPNWWLGPDDKGTFPLVKETEVDAWLVEDHPERTARFCLESASDFYARVADLQQKPDVVYYAEKYLPAIVPSMLLELDADAKEVFLVRDPRDQLASVVSWTAAGKAQFSKDATTADEYIDWLAPRTKNLLRYWQERSARSLLVRYEDLVLEPLPTLTRLFDYLDVDSSPETVAGVLESARTSGTELQRGHQTSKSPEQSIGRWRKDISPELWERFDEVFAPELEAWYPDYGIQETAAGPATAGD